MSDPNYRPPDLQLLGDEHVRVYRETNGETGYLWNGATILLLTTKGRRSGEQRTAPLIYAQDGDRFIVVASMGGAPRHPGWFFNLRSEPSAQVQIKGDVIPVTASVAEGDERARLWDVVLAQWPNYDVYQARTERVIPVVVLSPV
jgi:deazaflavin-dependent oxidoreductase (nitroreductase family)